MGGNNAGEEDVFNAPHFDDPGTTTSTNCVSVTSADVVISGGSLDGCQASAHAGGTITELGIHEENASYASHVAYSFNNIDLNGSIIMYGGEQFNDAPGGSQPSSFNTGVAGGGGNFSAFGVAAGHGGSASSVNEFYNGVTGGGQGFALMCNITGVAGTVGYTLLTTNIAAITTTPGCYMQVRNNFTEGSTIDGSGNYTFSENGLSFYSNHIQTGGTALGSINTFDGGATVGSTSIAVEGSYGGNDSINGSSWTISNTSPSFQVFTGSGVATATLPLISISNGLILNFVNRGTAILQIVASTTKPAFGQIYT